MSTMKTFVTIIALGLFFAGCSGSVSGTAYLDNTRVSDAKVSLVRATPEFLDLWKQAVKEHQALVKEYQQVDVGGDLDRARAIDKTFNTAVAAHGEYLRNLIAWARVAETRTDVNGAYAFKSVKRGDYYVTSLMDTWLVPVTVNGDVVVDLTRSNTTEMMYPEAAGVRTTTKGGN